MTKTIVYTIISVVLVVGILLGACYYIGSRPDKFSVIYDGKEVTDEVDGIGVSGSEPLTLTVTGAYTCTVIPREGVKLTFLEGEKTRSLSELTDVTAGFRIETAGDELTVTPVGGISLVLSRVIGKSVTADAYDDDIDLFTLLIESADGQGEREIHFGLYRYPVEGVTLSEEVIRF